MISCINLSIPTEPFSLMCITSFGTSISFGSIMYFMHSELVSNQLKELGIRELVFFSNKLENDNNLAPYHSCIKKACKNAGIKLTMEESNYIDW